MALKFKKKSPVIIFVFAATILFLILLLRPTNQCDYLNKNANISIGNGLASSEAVICLEKKIRQEIKNNPRAPDISLCFKPYYSEAYNCVIRIARETKNYSVCDQLYNISLKPENKWLCIGSVSQMLQDGNKCDAPDQHLKQICQEAQINSGTTEFLNFVI